MKKKSLKETSAFAPNLRENRHSWSGVKSGARTTIRLACVLRGKRAASTGTRPLGGKQCWYFHSESFCQDNQLDIGYTAKLRLDLRESGTAQFQPKNGTASGKQLLSQSLLITQFSDLWASNVLRLLSVWCHAPEMELDTNPREGLDCSGFGASFLSKRGGAGRTTPCFHEGLEVAIITFVKLSNIGKKHRFGVGAFPALNHKQKETNKQP